MPSRVTLWKTLEQGGMFHILLLVLKSPNIHEHFENSTLSSLQVNPHARTQTNTQQNVARNFHPTFLLDLLTLKHHFRLKALDPRGDQNSHRGLRYNTSRFAASALHSSFPQIPGVNLLVVFFDFVRILCRVKIRSQNPRF